MTKADVVSEIAKKTGIDKADVLACVEGFMEVVKDSLENGENVYLRGFGSFITKKRAAKAARDILKNTTITVPEHNIPAFKPAKTFAAAGANSEVVMSAPAWQEDQQSSFLQLVSNTFQDVLGWRPRMVAMHFVLEAGFFVQHYPGIQIASIGPRIVEPHSTSERVELSTIHDIWQVLLELLKRLA